MARGQVAPPPQPPHQQQSAHIAGGEQQYQTDHDGQYDNQQLGARVSLAVEQRANPKRLLPGIFAKTPLPIDLNRGQRRFDATQRIGIVDPGQCCPRPIHLGSVGRQRDGQVHLLLKRIGAACRQYADHGRRCTIDPDLPPDNARIRCKARAPERVADDHRRGRVRSEIGVIESAPERHRPAQQAKWVAVDQQAADPLGMTAVANSRRTHIEIVPPSQRRIDQAGYLLAQRECIRPGKREALRRAEAGSHGIQRLGRQRSRRVVGHQSGDCSNRHHRRQPKRQHQNGRQIAGWPRAQQTPCIGQDIHDSAHRLFLTRSAG